MQKQRLSLEEFKALFQDSFESQEELLSEYNSFLQTFEQLDQMPVPNLPSREKAMIFRKSWQGRPQEPSLFLSLIDFFRQPAVTFALGIVIGCIVTFVVAKEHRAPPEKTVTADKLLTVEHTRYTHTYKGKIINEFYPQFENPKIVVEKAEESSSVWKVKSSKSSSKIIKGYKYEPDNRRSRKM